MCPCLCHEHDELCLQCCQGGIDALTFIEIAVELGLVSKKYVLLPYQKTLLRRLLRESQAGYGPAKS